MLSDLIQIQELPNPSSEEMPPVPSSPAAKPSLGDPHGVFTVPVSHRQHPGRYNLSLTSMAVSTGDAESSSSPLGAHARLVTGLCPG